MWWCKLVPFAIGKALFLALAFWTVVARVTHAGTVYIQTIFEAFGITILQWRHQYMHNSKHTIFKRAFMYEHLQLHVAFNRLQAIKLISKQKHQEKRTRVRLASQELMQLDCKQMSWAYQTGESVQLPSQNVAALLLPPSYNVPHAHPTSRVCRPPL